MAKNAKGTQSQVQEQKVVQSTEVKSSESKETKETKSSKSKETKETKSSKSKETKETKSSESSESKETKETKSSESKETKETKETKSVVVYVKGQNDKDFRTSDGFFKDPFTGKEFTGNEERLQFGTKTPRIKDSKGNAIPIAYKLWTKEEREAFKSGTSSGSESSGSTGSSSKKNEELRKNLLSLQEYLETVLPGDEKVAEMIGAMLPPDPEQEKLAKKVAVMTEEQKAALRALLNA